jgi:hypothetical protein
MMRSLGSTRRSHCSRSWNSDCERRGQSSIEGGVNPKSRREEGLLSTSIESDREGAPWSMSIEDRAVSDDRSEEN